MKFSDKLRILCAKADLSQSELREKLDEEISRSTISNWFVGKHLPDISIGKKIAEILNVSLDDLADEEVSIPINMKENLLDRRIRDLVEMLGPEESIRRLLQTPGKIVVHGSDHQSEPSSVGTKKKA